MLWPPQAIKRFANLSLISAWTSNLSLVRAHTNVRGSVERKTNLSPIFIELNSTSSAFCGLFWDPKGNWIVVSFKGTAPLEFGEWLSDLNAKLVECALL